MIVAYRHLIKKVRRGSWALPTFNTFNLEMTQAILAGGMTERAPLVIEVSARSLEYAGPDFLSLVQAQAERAPIPVALHFDHGENQTTVRQALVHAFSSIMIAYDVTKSLEQNIKIARAVTGLAHRRNVSVQGEVGHVSGPKDHWRMRSNWLTKPEQAAEYVKKTEVDTLSVSIGNRHGIAAGSVQVDLELLKDIRRTVAIPLVLHGGSGLRTNRYADVIKGGISVINFDTDLRYTFGSSLRKALRLDQNLIDPRSALSRARTSVASTVREKIRACKAQGHA
jgi:tagatose 1,6-diphosphate aldolase GatY/KbaY